MRQRAIQPVDKQERHDAILDAAERLLSRAPERMASVAEVADEAGLAKGTVYLYFPSKEELLLAVHERNLDVFFSALNGLFERSERILVDDMLAITIRYTVGRPLFLPLAARCFALMAQSIPAPAAAAFRERMAARMERAGAGVERHFPRLAPGEGVARLRHSFALTLGLWQMSSASACGVVAPVPVPPVGRAVAANEAISGHPAQLEPAPSYADDLNRALRALWQAVTVPAPPR